jgi:anti-sigma B factor antagonist
LAGINNRLKEQRERVKGGSKGEKMKIGFQQVGGVTVLRLDGRLTLGEGSTQFREKVKELVANGHRSILVNMADVTYIDGAGIGELVSALTAVSNAGGQFKLLNLGKRTEDLLQITKLYTVFEVLESEAEALASFR